MHEVAVPVNNQLGSRWKTGEAMQPNINVGDMERLVSAVGGGLLTMYGLRHPPAGLVLVLLGGELLYRGISGYCPLYAALGINTANGVAGQPISYKRAVTINRSPAEAYRFWRDFENLPRFMKHLEAVKVIDRQRSHWVAKGPAGTRVEWDAEIFLEKENELIAWRSLANTQVPNAGTVRFTPAPGGRGCEVKVIMEYVPPGGKLGALVAKLFGEEPGRQVADDLYRFKQIMEAGEIPVAKAESKATEAESPVLAKETGV